MTTERQLLARLRASRWLPLPIVLSGTFMIVLDFFIVNVALPSIQSNLHCSSDSLEWVAAGYGLTSAVFLITAGRLGDRYGRRRVFSLGLALFTLSSAACGAASTPTILVPGLMLVGAGMGLGIGLSNRSLTLTEPAAPQPPQLNSRRPLPRAPEPRRTERCGRGAPLRPARRTAKAPRRRRARRRSRC